MSGAVVRILRILLVIVLAWPEVNGGTLVASEVQLNEWAAHRFQQPSNGNWYDGDMQDTSTSTSTSTTQWVKATLRVLGNEANVDGNGRGGDADLYLAECDAHPNDVPYSYFGCSYTFGVDVVEIPLPPGVDPASDGVCGFVVGKALGHTRYTLSMALSDGEPTRTSSLEGDRGALAASAPAALDDRPQQHLECFSNPTRFAPMDEGSPSADISGGGGSASSHDDTPQHTWGGDGASDGTGDSSESYDFKSALFDILFGLLEFVGDILV